MREAIQLLWTPRRCPPERCESLGQGYALLGHLHVIAGPRVLDVLDRDLYLGPSTPVPKESIGWGISPPDLGTQQEDGAPVGRKPRVAGEGEDRPDDDRVGDAVEVDALDPDPVVWPVSARQVGVVDLPGDEQLVGVDT